MLGNFLVDFLPILYQIVKNYFLFIQKASISNYRCYEIKCSWPKKLVWKSFFTIFYNPDHCALPRFKDVAAFGCADKFEINRK